MRTGSKSVWARPWTWKWPRLLFGLPMRHPTRTTTIVISAVLLMLVLWGWLWAESLDWWAAAGQWVGGIGSALAALVALWIARTDWRRAEHETRRAEASRIAVWLQGKGNARYEVIYNNLTPLPAYRAIARLTWAEDEVLLPLGMLPPTSGPSRLQQSLDVDLAFYFSNKLAEHLGANADGAKVGRALDDLSLEVQFFRAGQYWRIDRDGELRTITEEEARVSLPGPRP